MNTFTFKINKNGNSSNNTANTSSYIGSIIRTNLKKAMPSLFGESKKTIVIDDIMYDTIDIMPKKHKKIDIDITIKKNKKNRKPRTSGNKFIEFANAIKFLSDMDPSYMDTADFYTSDGIPVKFFGDEIQIGYDLIPLRKSSSYYNGLSSKTKKDIIDIVINISK